MLALLVVAQASQGQLDLDTQLYHPTFVRTGYLTHAGAKLESSPVLLGVALQVEHAPLVAEPDGVVVVPTRGTLHLGVAVTLFDALALELSMPTSLISSSVPMPPLAFGDLRVGVTWRAWDFDLVTVALGAALALPTATTGGYVGEGAIRGGPSGAIELDLGPVSTLVGASLMLRDEIDTGHGLVIGSELNLIAALALGARDAEVRAVAELRARVAFAEPPKSAGADPVTADLALRWRPAPMITWTLALGTALSQGYGAADVRTSLALALSLDAPGSSPRAPPPPEPRLPLAELLALPEELEPRAGGATPAAAAPPEDFLEALLGDPPSPLRSACVPLGVTIPFELGRAELDAEAQRLIARVAAELRADPIVHVVISGYASSEGLAPLNWGLSQRRAERVFVALVEAGVRPSMLSIRGSGERSPAASPDDRRVELCSFGRDRFDGPTEETWTLPWEEP